MAQPKNSSGIPSGGGLVCDENDKWDARFHRKVGEPRCFSAAVWRDVFSTWQWATSLKPQQHFASRI